MIAVIGGDGSGKSTALAALQRWLGSELDVDVVHIGKPTWSATTIAIRAALKALGALSSGVARTLPIAPTRAAAAAVADLRPLVWLLCTARDRRRTYRAARRRVARGQIVLCDRHPAPNLTGMEAPLIARRANSRQDGRLVQAMARLEESYHRAIGAPDLLAVLRVDPEIAVKRKRSEPAASVRARSAEIWRIDWSSTHAHVVDASRPADAVAAELKALVWSMIAGGAHGDHGQP
jgi:thymidylate kinase